MIDVSFREKSHHVRLVELAEELVDRENPVYDPLSKNSDLPKSSRVFCWIRRCRKKERSSQELIADLSRRLLKNEGPLTSFQEATIRTASEEMSRRPKDGYTIYSDALKEILQVQAVSRVLIYAVQSMRQKWKQKKASVEAKTEKRPEPQVSFAFRKEDIPPLSSFNRNNINTMFSTFRADKTTILHQIAMNGKVSEAARLIEMGANLNAQEENEGEKRNTPLLWAIANAQNSMVKRLIEWGKNQKANWDLQAFPQGNTAMHLLIAKGYREKSQDGQLLEYSNGELVKDLIEARADVNIQDACGNTPLHIACARRDEEVCKLLLSNRAVTNLQNLKGETPISLLDYPYKKTIAMLHYQAHSFFLSLRQYEDLAVVARIKASFSR